MRLVAVLAVICGSTGAHADDPSGDANAVSANMLVTALQSFDLFVPLLHDTVDVGGISFDDESCAKRFGTFATVKRRDRAALYACLRGLNPSLDLKMFDGEVATYGASMILGIDSTRGQISRIGAFASDHTDDRLPTFLLWTRGFRASAATRAAVGDTIRTLIVKLCYDASGAVTSERVAQSSGVDALDRELFAFYRGQAITPPKQHGRPISACGVAIEQYPLPPQNVPPTALDGYRTAGTKKIVPNAATQRVIAASGKNRIISSVKYCIDEAGAISSAKFLKSSGFPDYDATMLAGIEAWRFKPYVINGNAVPVCTAVTFIYP